MEFIDMLKKRRSIRQYTKEAVTGEQLQLVINAGLLSPSSRSIRPWELIVVQNKDTLQKMSECRVGSAKMLANASAAVVVIANAEKSDVWTGLEAAGSRDVYGKHRTDSLRKSICGIY